MTNGDTFFLVMLLVQFTSLAAMVVAALRIMDTMRRAERTAAPVTETLRETAMTGRAIAQKLQVDSRRMVDRLTRLAEALQARVRRTRALAAELKPAAEGTGAAVRQGAADLVETARVTQELGGRLSRIGRALRAARNAGRGTEKS